MSTLQKVPQISVQRGARILAVVAIALAAGHLMHTLAARKPVAQVMAAAVIPQNIVQLSASNAAETVLVGPQTDKPMELVLAATTELVVQQLATAPMTVTICPVDLALDGQPSAMIGIVLVAPCHVEERVVLRHAGLAVTARLDKNGRLNSVLPALMSTVVVEVLFSDGTTVDGALNLPEAATLRRFGVQWQGAEAFVVHGFENGADFDQPGDVSPTNLGTDYGGSLALLGDGTVEVPLLAQIYTFPSEPGQMAEVVIEAAVTKATCGHDLLAETIASTQDQVEITDLTLAMPDCSGVGDFLVLKNLASDMKIAAN